MAQFMSNSFPGGSSSSNPSSTNQSMMIEIYENEIRKGGDWQPHSRSPWVSAMDGEACTSRDEYQTLGPEWMWTCNWKVKYRESGICDVDGWEYASKLDRLYCGGLRTPRGEAKWSDKARRRLWYRLMKRDVKKPIEIRKAIPRIQENLSSVHTTRVRIENLIRQTPGNAGSSEMNALVEKVKMNIYDLLDALDQLEEANTDEEGGKRYIAVLKKLRNDCLREEEALLRSSEQALAGKGSAGGGGRKSTSGGHRTSIGGNSRISMNQRGSKRPLQGGDSSTNDSEQRLSHLLGDEAPASAASSIQASRSSVMGRNGNRKGTLDMNVHKQSIPEYASIHGDLENKWDDDFADLSTSPGKRPGGGGGGFGAGTQQQVEGVFVPRDQHEQMIEQKLIPVDEATLMQELIDERSLEIEQIHKGIVEVRETFMDLGQLVRQQSVDIQAIFENTEESAEKSRAGLESVRRAEKIQTEGCAVV